MKISSEPTIYPQPGGFFAPPQPDPVQRLRLVEPSSDAASHKHFVGEEQSTKTVLFNPREGATEHAPMVENELPSKVFAARTRTRR